MPGWQQSNYNRALRKPVKKIMVKTNIIDKPQAKSQAKSQPKSQ